MVTLLTRQTIVGARRMCGGRFLHNLPSAHKSSAIDSFVEERIDRALENVTARLADIRVDHVAAHQVNTYIQKRAEEFKDRSFHVVDIRKIVERVALWRETLPRVRPYFSVKTNHDPVILATLAALNVGFDCSTIEEIRQACSTIGAHPGRDVIFAHPRKPRCSITESLNMGVQMMVVDSLEELQKISAVHAIARPKILIRIQTDDSSSGTPLSTKFGASIEESQEMIERAFEHRIQDIEGVSFHVGSNNCNPDAYVQAIEDAARLFRFFKHQYGRELRVLDIGGGWPGDQDESFIKIAKEVNSAIEKHMSLSTKVVAEPGRFLCLNSTTLVSKVLGKKVDFSDQGNKKIAYFINNGVYGFFLSSLYYNHDLKKSLREGWKFTALQGSSGPCHITKLWGPTLDSGDLVADGIQLPELEEGELILTEGIGCYGRVYESAFSQQAHSVPCYIVATPV